MVRVIPFLTLKDDVCICCLDDNLLFMLRISMWSVSQTAGILKTRRCIIVIKHLENRAVIWTLEIMTLMKREQLI